MIDVNINYMTYYPVDTFISDGYAGSCIVCMAASWRQLHIRMDRSTRRYGKHSQRTFWINDSGLRKLKSIGPESDQVLNETLPSLATINIINVTMVFSTVSRLKYLLSRIWFYNLSQKSNNELYGPVRTEVWERHG